MFKSQKHVFWEALLITVLIFGLGVFIGVVIESWRTSRISDLYQQADVQLLDIKTQNEIFSLEDFDCETAMEENIKFADRIYEEAKILDRYETARRLTDSLKLQHKKYDVLRALLWINSMKIKKSCRGDYHNVVYIYKYNDPGLEVKAKQSVFANILAELKQEKGNEIILIPMAGDNDLSSVSLLMDMYDITEEELPIILIDERFKITEIESVREIEKLL